jgi:predicted pyridoxine 5'-phosphate oxidase superfamily flavin-nucleotide-binding protein
VLRSAMPMQHREFFPLLPFVVLGAVDATGQPTATILSGAPGFAWSPDERSLRIDALPAPDDPLPLRSGHALGLLGIELPTRRRNRANGVVSTVDDTGFTLDVQQSFGNCPRYIEPRDSALAGPGTARTVVSQADRLDGAAASLVSASDSFFIATHAPGDGAAAGSDVSHRGGPPGFVRLDDGGRTLAWPDYPGNGFFNTMGNLLLEPRAGLVFADHASGDLLHVWGRVEIVWGESRSLRMRVQQMMMRKAASRAVTSP